MSCGADRPTATLMSDSLPNLDQPLPDEILGSWLARLQLLNGAGAWSPMLSKCGMPRRFVTNVFDREALNGPLLALLDALGMSRSDVNSQMTTLPFWLAFGTVSSGDGSSEAEGVPMKNDPGRPLETSGRRAAPRRIGGVTPPPRYCPECLRADLAEHGCPYWHRTHQLPVSLVCPHHAVPLRYDCSSCNAVVSPWSKKLALTLPRRCRACNEELGVTLPSERRGVFLNYVALAKFAHEALQSSGPVPAFVQALGAFRQVLRETRIDSKRGYKDVLKGAYGLEPISTRALVASSMRDALGLCDALSVEAASAMARAPEIAAFLSASGFEFSAARLLFHAQKSDKVVDSEDPTVSREGPDWTIPDARAALGHLIGEPGDYSLKESLRHRPRLFWFLRIFDAAWLEAMIGSMHRHRLPTVLQDRAAVDLYAERNEGRIEARTPLRSKPEYIRASLRDKEWFNQKRQQLESRREARALLARASTQSGRANLLSQTIADAVTSRDRPVRLTVMSLSRTSGLSMEQIREVVDFHPGVQEEIDQANDGLIRRKLIWAGHRLREQDRPITPAYLCTTAGFYSNDPEALPIAMQILGLFVGP